MHIVHLSRIIWEHGTHGGMEMHSRLVINGLRKRGHRVTTITTTGVPATSERIAVDAPATKYSAEWWQTSAAAVADLHQRDPIDLLWSQSSAGRSAWRNGPNLPTVATLHGTIETEWRTRRQNLRSLRGLAQAARFLWTTRGETARWQADMAHLTHLIAVSQEVSTSIQATCGTRPEQISVVPNGIDTTLFAPLTSKPSRERPVLLAAGRLRREKGFQLCLALLTKLDATLKIAGDGADRAWLEQQARTLGIAARVQFLGMLDSQTLAQQMRTADLFLLPTLRHEGLPITLLEAMASQLPIVATNVGGIAAAIDDGENGLLFPMGDVEALMGQVARVLEDADFGRKLAHNARAKAVAKYSVDQMVDTTEAIFHRCVNRSS